MKAIKHSHYEQYLRLSNDDAALLVGSGRWVFVSKFEARKAIERQRPGRPLWLRIGLFVTTLAMIIATLLLTTSARATDLKVPKLHPYKVCLTQSQAAAVYPGKHLRYREIGRDKCWYYTSGKTPKKAEFISRPTSVASKPFRAIQQDTQRARDLAGAVPATGDFSQYEQESGLSGAIAALCGEPCPHMIPFDAMWDARVR